MSRGLVVSIISTPEVGSPLARLVPKWLIKALKVGKEKSVQSAQKEIVMLSEVITTTMTPMEIPSRMMYLGIDKQDYLISQIIISPLHYCTKI